MWRWVTTAVVVTAACFTAPPAGASMPPTTFVNFSLPVAAPDEGNEMLRVAGPELEEHGLTPEPLPARNHWRTPSEPRGHAHLTVMTAQRLQMSMYGAITSEQERTLIEAVRKRLETRFEQPVAVDVSSTGREAATKPVPLSLNLVPLSSIEIHPAAFSPFRWPLAQLALVVAVNIGATFFLYGTYIAVTRRVIAWRARHRVFTGKGWETERKNVHWVEAGDTPFLFAMLMLLEVPFAVISLGYLAVGQTQLLYGDPRLLMVITGAQLAWTMYRHPVNAKLRGLPYAGAALAAIVACGVLWPTILNFCLGLMSLTVSMDVLHWLGVAVLVIGYLALGCLLQAAINRLGGGDARTARPA